MTKTLYTNGPPGVTPTAMKLFSVVGDTVLNTVVPSVGANDSTLAAGIFVALAAARYRIVLYLNTVELSTDHITVGDNDGFYLADDLVASVSDGLELSPGNIASIVAGVTAQQELIAYPAHAQQMIRTEGDDWILEFQGLGSLAGRTNMVWVLKSSRSDRDESAVLKVDETIGLLLLQGSPDTASNATLVVTDEGVGDVRVTIKSAASKSIRSGVYADGLKMIHPTVSTSYRNKGELVVQAGTVD